MICTENIIVMSVKRLKMIESEYDENTHVYTISIEGKFSFASHMEFRESYEPFLVHDVHYCIDLSKTDFMDSSALGMLLLFKSSVDSCDFPSSIIIRGANTDVSKLLKISNFQKVFHII